jgi:dTDP-4-dehydrorhamnose 3,5-epimerase/reductase
MTVVGHTVTAERTAIPGMFVIDSPVHTDERGSFTEAYRRESLLELGVPELTVVQHNVATNARAGVTRGVHAEPWHKLATVARGRVLQAVVDLRAGPQFGHVAVVDVAPGRSVLIPKGCGNAYQALEDDTVYSYLVTGHWSPDVSYPAVDPFDSALDIPWRFGRDDAIVSAKDRANPPLSSVTPLDES